jgi:hypothetical protein
MKHLDFTIQRGPSGFDAVQEITEKASDTLIRRGLAA